jgi:two-component system chemotaxis response regulator CheB
MRISRDIVAIGVLGENNSRSMEKLIAGLPTDFPASILIVLQIPAEVSTLEKILIGQGSLPVVRSREGQDIRRGCVYLGSSHASLVTRPWGVLGLEPAMANDHHHFAVNRFFDSAAHVWGNRVIGVLLNPENAAHAIGLAAVKAAGGIAVIEDAEGNFASSLGDEVDPDESHRLLPSPAIADLLAKLVEMPQPKLARHFSFKKRRQQIYDC